jgi:phenylacetate-CoA ligase
LGILRKICLSVFDDTEDLLDNLSENKPDVISGYPSILRLLAKKIKEDSIRGINPRLMFTHAELLDDKTRDIINSVFGVELSDLYGCMEVGPISWQCSMHDKYHINIDYLIVEFIKDNEIVNPGERGEIVVTGLHSFAMPFIRYKIGDFGIPIDEKCNCGRGLPLMKGIEGRIVDSIILPSGRIISPYVLTCITENIPGINRYQIIQKNKNLIILRYIKNEKFSKKTIDKIKENYKRFLGNDIEINPVCVDELIPDKSGKFRVVKSLVSKELQ